MESSLLTFPDSRVQTRRPKTASRAFAAFLALLTAGYSSAGSVSVDIALDRTRGDRFMNIRLMGSLQIPSTRVDGLRIAELSGGKCLGMRQIKDLPSLLNLERHEETYTTEIPLWDNAWVILLLVAFMGTEWIVRRRYDLP